MLSVDDLRSGEGWTPGRIWKLRCLMGDDKPMFREDFAKGLSTSERQIYRWEHGTTTRIGPLFRKALGQMAVEKLSPEALAELAAYEGPYLGDEIPESA